MIDRATLAAIHVAKKQLALEDDSYRDLLQRVAGVRSARDLDEAGARRVMTEFERLGFTNQTKRRAGHDSRPLARKARALWISLHNLDEIDNADDRALAAFARRLTGKETLRFCDAKELNQVVEALKAWGARVGWTKHTLLGVYEVQARRLDTAHALTGADDPACNPDLTVQTNRLGERLRRLQLGARHKNPPTGQGAAT